MRITEEELRKMVETDGLSLTEIAEIKKVDPSYVSKLCKRWGIQAPPPGRIPGSVQTEETKRKIGETVKKKYEEKL